jgi:hypothetical protein
MSDNEVLSRDQLQSRLDGLLESLDAESKSTALALLFKLFPEVHPDNLPSDYKAINRSLNEKHTYYAIQGEDLKIVKEASAIAAACAALLHNPIGAVGGLVTLLYQYRKRRIKLDERQSLVLLELKRAGTAGSTVDTLRYRLSRRIDLKTDEIQTTLEQLKSVRRTDNTTATLVSESEGIWRSVDV